MAMVQAAPAFVACAHERGQQVAPRAQQWILAVVCVQQVAVLAVGRVGVLF